MNLTGRVISILIVLTLLSLLVLGVLTLPPILRLKSTDQPAYALINCRESVEEFDQGLVYFCLTDREFLQSLGVYKQRHPELIVTSITPVWEIVGTGVSLVKGYIVNFERK